jgi:hypothetical protein
MNKIVLIVYTVIQFWNAITLFCHVSLQLVLFYIVYLTANVIPYWITSDVNQHNVRLFLFSCFCLHSIWISINYINWLPILIYSVNNKWTESTTRSHVTGVAEKAILRSLTVHTNVSCQCNLPAQMDNYIIWLFNSKYKRPWINVISLQINAIVMQCLTI